MDIVDTETRSRMMASVCKRDTAREMKVAKALHSIDLRYRLHPKDTFGIPGLDVPAISGGQFRARLFLAWAWLLVLEAVWLGSGVPEEEKRGEYGKGTGGKPYT